MVQINPKKLKPTPEISKFEEGYVLDYHTVNSIPTSDPYYRFDTKRTELGELLYLAKYKNSGNENEFLASMSRIIETAQDFIEEKKWLNAPLECIVPAPSSLSRNIQPVSYLAKKLAENFDLAFEEALFKVGKPRQMKNIESFEERRGELENTVKVKQNAVQGKNILLLDDIFESGATLRRSIEVLIKEGGARAVFALILTRTR